jgi:3-dehydrosphinganine reductase
MRAWAGQRVIVTGGSSGIGLATAQLLSAAGASVWLVGRRAALLDAALDEVRAVALCPPEQRFGRTTLDVGDAEAVRRALPEAIDGLDGLDALISNAGIVCPGLVDELGDAAFEAMMRTNYFGGVWLVRACLPHLSRGGRIVLVSSLAGLLGIYGYTGYAASKYALAGFAEALRQELVPRGISVSIAFPPDTDTPGLTEENLTKPRVTAAVAGAVKPLSAEHVARALLRGAAARRYQIVPGAMTRLTYRLHRYLPWLVRGVIDRSIRRALGAGRTS